MNDNRLRVIASIGLIIGGVFGMAGTFAPSASLRGLAWGIDGAGSHGVAGVSLWAAALVLISTPPVFPSVVRGLGLTASALFAAVALQIFGGKSISPITAPLPFYAYPFFAATIFGWTWVLLRANAKSETRGLNGRRHG